VGNAEAPLRDFEVASDRDACGGYADDPVARCDVALTDVLDSRNGKRDTDDSEDRGGGTVDDNRRRGRRRLYHSVVVDQRQFTSSEVSRNARSRLDSLALVFDRLGDAPTESERS